MKNLLCQISAILLAFAPPVCALTPGEAAAGFVALHQGGPDWADSVQRADGGPIGTNWTATTGTDAFGDTVPILRAEYDANAPGDPDTDLYFETERDDFVLRFQCRTNAGDPALSLREGNWSIRISDGTLTALAPDRLPLEGEPSPFTPDTSANNWTQWEVRLEDDLLRVSSHDFATQSWIPRYAVTLGVGNGSSPADPGRIALSVIGSDTAADFADIRLKPLQPPPRESIVFPSDAGVIDITQPPYNADPTGFTDSTPAIQQALDDHPNGNRIIYFPNGNYRITDRLDYGDGPPGNNQKRTILQGQSRDGARIFLPNATPGYIDPNNPKALVWTGNAPAQRFRNAIRNLTFDVGADNPGAIGVQFIANNQGSLRDVRIRSLDRGGAIGLDMSHSDEIGPLLARDIEVEGFDTGIRTYWQLNSVTFENVTLRNQNVYGWHSWQQVVTARNVTSFQDSDIPAIFHEKDGPGHFILIGGRFHATGPGAPYDQAILNEKAFYGRDIETTGYTLAVKNDDKGREGPDAPGGSVTEHFSHDDGQVITLFPDQNASPLDLPVLETPEVPWDPPADWANIEDFGAVGDDSLDDTAAIQAAIDSGATTVFVPAGKIFTLLGTLELRGPLRRFIGCDGQFDGNGTFKVVDGADPSADAPIVVFERITGPSGQTNLTFEHASSRTVVLSSIVSMKTRGTGSGNFFMDDCATIPVFENPEQRIWARQLNVENDGVHVDNRGAMLWVLGYKTERNGTLIHTTNGGFSEFFGAFLYSNLNVSNPEPAFVNDDANVSVFGFVERDFNSSPVTEWVDETRNGLTETYSRTQLLNDVPNGPVAYAGYENTARALPPTIDPGSGEYADQVTVSLTPATAGDPIFHTLDGTEPDTDGLLYVDPFVLTETATVKARTFPAERLPSGTSTAVFTVEPAEAPAITSSPPDLAFFDRPFEYSVVASGTPDPTFALPQAPTGMTINSETGRITWTPDASSPDSVDVTVSASNGIGTPAEQSFPLDLLALRAPDTPSSTTEPGLRRVDYAGAFNEPPESGDLHASSPAVGVNAPDPAVSSWSARNHYGFLSIPTTGKYVFHLSADAGARLRIGGTNVVTAAGVGSESSGSIGLESGLHRFELMHYSREASGSLQLEYEGPDLSRRPIPESAWQRYATPYGRFSRGPVPAPYLNFSSSPGGPQPTVLSATGAFENLPGPAPAPGLLPYEVNLSQADAGDAKTRRWIALPDGARLGYHSEGPWAIPPGTVLIQHFEIGDENRKVETRFLIFRESGEAFALTYRWRDDQTEADLVPPGGIETTVHFDEVFRESWHFPSRSACLDCHNGTAGYALGTRTGQLHRSKTFATTGLEDDQLRTLRQLGLLEGAPAESALPAEPRWHRADALEQPLESRARAFLGTNCAACHNPSNDVNGADFDARFATDWEATGLLGESPDHDLGLDGAALVKPGDPVRSVLFRRLAHNDPGFRMPPVVTRDLPQVFMDLIHDWILGMEPDPLFVDVLDASHRWKLDGDLEETQGGPTGNWRDGGTASFQADAVFGQSVALDGVDDAIDLPAFDLSGSEVTFSLWFKLDDGDVADARFLSKAVGQNADEHYWMLSTIGDRGLRFRLKAGGTTETLASADAVFNPDTWTHFAAVYDGSFMRLYADGTEIGVKAHSGEIDSAPSVPLAFGNQPLGVTGGTRPLDGKIDDLRIYHRALPPSEIQTLADAPLTFNTLPEVTIDAPTGEVILAENDSLSLQGGALDAEDGDLSSDILWASSRDGLLGSGDSVTIAELSAGLHKIVVSVLDSAGAANTADKIIEVIPGFSAWTESVGLYDANADPGADPEGDGTPNLLEYAFGLDPHQADLPRLVPSSANSHARVTFEIDPDAIDLIYDLEIRGTLSPSGNWRTATRFEPDSGGILRTDFGLTDSIEAADLPNGNSQFVEESSTPLELDTAGPFFRLNVTRP